MQLPFPAAASVVSSYYIDASITFGTARLATLAHCPIGIVPER